ncbi:MAG: glycosyltransferase [Candidatus Ancaeobacter aquaticus]|nr:glycosyltransferase [Candidatus Ancaeobacter aquaticus]
MNFSVIIPTHNRKDILPLTLRALEEQREYSHEYEVIIIDDGSHDGTREYLQTYNPKRPHCIKIYQQHNGPACARNAGIKRARGDTIVFIGDDTVPDQLFLSQHEQSHRRFANSIVVGYTSWHPKCAVSPFMDFLDRSGLQFSYNGLQEYQEIDYNMFYTSNISVPREILQTESFDEKFPYAAFEDIELGYRLYNKGVKSFYCPHAKCFHYHYYEDEKMILARQKQIAESLLYMISRHPELEHTYIKKYRKLIEYAAIALCNPMTKCINKDLYWHAGMIKYKYKHLNALLSHKE